MLRHRNQPPVVTFGHLGVFVWKWPTVLTNVEGMSPPPTPQRYRELRTPFSFLYPLGDGEGDWVALLIEVEKPAKKHSLLNKGCGAGGECGLSRLMVFVGGFGDEVGG